MYIFHLISIDLQLSCLFNSTTLQLLQLWARIALPAKQLIYLLHHQIYYLIQEVTTSITFASVLSFFGYALVLVITFFTYQTNGRSISTDDRTRPTNETDELN